MSGTTNFTLTFVTILVLSNAWRSVANSSSERRINCTIWCEVSEYRGYVLLV